MTMPSVMQAVVFDRSLHATDNYPVPQAKSDWALIRVLAAGICGTDIEITRGYKGFQGVPGHEFVGVVAHGSWQGRRVTGQINVVCDQCRWCRMGMPKHCANRRVLGMLGLDGCMADYCMLPQNNLVALPDNLPLERAIWIEPLAAACELMHVVARQQPQRAVVLGDGRLGILCAWVLAAMLDDVLLIGRHPWKLERAQWHGLQTVANVADAAAGADLVVDATGSASGFAQAVSLCRPRGALVLKSTLAGTGASIDLTPVVVNELHVVGSRCGDFAQAIQMLQTYPDMPLQRLITHRFALAEACRAFDAAMGNEGLKVILKP